MKFAQSLLCLSLILAVSANVSADDAKQAGKKKKGRKKPTPTQRFLAKIELTDEQKTQVTQIDEKFTEPLAALRKKTAAIFTEEQTEARQMALKAAKEAGKKGAESRKAAEEAVELTEDQQAQQKELSAARRKLEGEILAALKEILTEEQQKALPKQRKAKKKKGKKGKLSLIHI